MEMNNLKKIILSRDKVRSHTAWKNGIPIFQTRDSEELSDYLKHFFDASAQIHVRHKEKFNPTFSTCWYFEAICVHCKLNAYMCSRWLRYLVPGI